MKPVLRNQSLEISNMSTIDANSCKGYSLLDILSCDNYVNLILNNSQLYSIIPPYISFQYTINLMSLLMLNPSYRITDHCDQLHYQNTDHCDQFHYEHNDTTLGQYIDRIDKTTLHERDLLFFTPKQLELLHKYGVRNESCMELTPLQDCVIKDVATNVKGLKLLKKI